MGRPLTTALGAAALLLMVAGCGRLPYLPSARNQPPTAELGISPAEGIAPFTATADSSGSFDADGTIVRREIMVGDGPFQEIAEIDEVLITGSGELPVVLRVTDDSGASATTEARVVARAAEAGDFAIDLLFRGEGFTSERKESFGRAAARWSEVIVGDLRDVTVSGSQVEQSCGAGYRYSGPIDDLLVFAELRRIDGSGGIVAMAGACLLRQDGSPAAGVMVFDLDDMPALERGDTVESVVLHEMGHVLELNAFAWTRRGLLQHDRDDCYDSARVSFRGQSAAHEFSALGGRGSVPVEDNGVVGTACSHWDEEVFRNELMTGYLDRDMRLSRVTVAALADMAYVVDFDAADPYTLPSTLLPRGLAAGARVDELLLEPGGVLGDDGSFTPLPDRHPLRLELNLPGQAHEGHAH